MDEYSFLVLGKLKADRRASEPQWPANLARLPKRSDVPGAALAVTVGSVRKALIATAAAVAVNLAILGGVDWIFVHAPVAPGFAVSGLRLAPDPGLDARVGKAVALVGNQSHAAR